MKTKITKTGKQYMDPGDKDTMKMKVSLELDRTEFDILLEALDDLVEKRIEANCPPDKNPETNHIKNMYWELCNKAREEGVVIWGITDTRNNVIQSTKAKH